MTTFNDVLKNSFLNEVSVQNFSLSKTFMALTLTVVIGTYIFCCYKYLTRKTFYSKNFNIALIVIALIVCGIILAIQSSVVISLGMVGALSIVRFRTAIKDPMDLAFLFWSISVGIICGAHLSSLAIILSVLITIVIMVFDRLPTSKVPQILIINGQISDVIDGVVEEVLKEYTKIYTEKSRSISNGKFDVVYELKVTNGIELSKKLSGVEGVHGVSLLKHDGEVTF